MTSDQTPDQADEQREAAWGYPCAGESRWPAAAAVAAAIGLNLRLPDKLAPGPHYVVPGLAMALLLPLMIANPSHLSRESRDLRLLSIALIALVNLANVVSLVLLVHYLLAGGKANGHELIRAGIGIWVTLVLVFALWYWEIDRGGPIARASPEHARPDLLFPQMENPGVTKQRWTPWFLDYLYVSLTNATAFSPTDVMPLARWAKMTMLVQSAVSLALVVLVVARAVNILS